MFFFFFFKQKTAYEMRISDWSSDVCSSDLVAETELARSEPGEPDRAGGREQVEHHGGDDGQRRGAAGRRARSLGFLVHRQGHVPSPEDEDRQRQHGRARAERIELKKPEDRREGKRGVSRCRSVWAADK